MADDQLDTTQPEPRRLRRRTAFIAAGAAGLVIVGGGVALASTSGPASPSAAPGYGTHSSGAPTGAKPTGAKPTGTDRPQPKPQLAGTVKSATGSTILITDMQGFTRTIKTSSSTKYDDSLTADPAVGTKIAATGTVDADGTSLDATEVQTPKGPADGGHGPGGGAGNGGGGRPPQGAAPTNTPSAKSTS